MVVEIYWAQTLEEKAEVGPKSRPESSEANNRISGNKQTTPNGNLGTKQHEGGKIDRVKIMCKRVQDRLSAAESFRD